MRIVYLHQYFNTPKMAGGTRSYEMARRLVQSGHEVHIVTSWREQRASKEWFDTEEDGIVVHWLAVPYSNTMGFLSRMRAFLRFAWASGTKAATIQADIVFATSTPLTIAIPGAYASRKTRAPMVFEVRDMWPDVPVALGVLKNRGLIWLARKLEQFAYSRSARIVALAPGMKEDIAAKGVDPEKIEVIPNGCDLGLFGAKCEGYLPHTGDRSLIYAGAIGKANGVDYLVSVAEELKRLNSDIQLIVVGDGQEKEGVTVLAESKGVLGDNFHMYDGMPKVELVPWLQDATMHVALMRGPYSYTKDAVNNKFFDALACGKPIANNFDGWQAELAEEAGVGVRLDPADHAGAAQELIRAFDDESWIAGVRERTKLLAEQRFDRSVLAAQLEQVLVEVHQSHKKLDIVAH